MCGIAGIVDLTCKQRVPINVLERMSTQLIHRGPDESGCFTQRHLGLASRRLSIVGLSDGQQPVANECGDVVVVYNGELFDYPEMRANLERRGHHFKTHCDTEVLPHLWEDHQEQMLERLNGQFALALCDLRRRRLVIARDRFGICPLYWTRQRKGESDWLLFASEIKSLLASGLVRACPEPRGIDQAFSFFAQPGPLTCFEGIHALLPGHYLQITLDPSEAVYPGSRVHERIYWQIDFPNRGEEELAPDSKKLIDRFESVMLQAVERRLRADVPVVSYLSGGVDSSLVAAMASHVRGQPIPTFTIRITDPALDETSQAAIVSRHLGAPPVVVDCGAPEVLANYPRLIRAAESPVLDPSCAALLLLAEEVHARGYKVALTGEGSDEWLAGYPWYKIHRALSFLDCVPGMPLSQFARRAYLRLTKAPRLDWSVSHRLHQAPGGQNAWSEIYGLIGLSRLRFFSPTMHETLGDFDPYSDLSLNLERMRRWHPLNRSLYLGARVHLPGLLLNAKGDRVAMHSSVETRYPFLDENVFDFLSKVRPNWKMNGFQDKYLLRLLAERWLPREIAWRRKAMFRAPFDYFHGENIPAYVDQLLSEESLRRTGYFEPRSVSHWRLAFRSMRPNSNQRTSIEMGLVGVLSTQLWHHTFIDGSLADLPSQARMAYPLRAAV